MRSSWRNGITGGGRVITIRLLPLLAFALIIIKTLSNGITGGN
jgi:hypothetical protein